MHLPQFWVCTATAIAVASAMGFAHAQNSSSPNQIRSAPNPAVTTPSQPNSPDTTLPTQRTPIGGGAINDASRTSTSSGANGSSGPIDNRNSNTLSGNNGVPLEFPTNRTNSSLPCNTPDTALGTVNPPGERSANIDCYR